MPTCYRLRSTLVFLILFISPIPVICFAQNLPKPVGIPTGPGVAAPGGKAFPRMTALPAKKAPAIAATADMTFPGETLVISGFNLEGAKLNIWAEGVVKTIMPLQTAPDRMLAVVPADLPHGTLIIWPVKGKTVGSPIRINAATTWWLWPARAYSGRDHQILKLMGMNMRLKGEAQPKIYIKGNGTATFLPVKRAEPYSLEANIPKMLKPGKYVVWTHNGTGGKYGWSEPHFLNILADKHLPKKQYRVDAFGAKPNDQSDDSDAIQKAADEAAKTGGNLKFSEGTYYVQKPVSIGSDTHLSGAGMGLHDSKTHTITGTHTLVKYLPPEKEKEQEMIYTFEETKSGKRPDLGDRNIFQSKEGIAEVTDKHAANGSRSMMFGDGPNLHRKGAPWFANRIRARKGEFDVSFNIKQDKASPCKVILEFRDRTNKQEKQPYTSFLRMNLDTGGNLSFNNKYLLSIPTGTWAKVAAKIKVGKDANGTATVTVTPEGGSSQSEKTAFTGGNPKELTEFAFYCPQEKKGTFYLDDLSITRIKLPRIVPQLLVFKGDNSSIKNISLFNVHDGYKEHVIAAYGRDLVFRKTRLIMLDVRKKEAWNIPYDKKTHNHYGRDRVIDTGALEIYTPKDANITVEGCEMMSCGGGIRVGGEWGPGLKDAETHPPAVEYLRIANMKYRSYYQGTPTKLPYDYESGRASPVIINQGKKIIVEYGDFAAADRYNGFCMNRTIDLHCTCGRHLYYAHNTSRHTAPHDSAGMDDNQGEQFIFHYNYPQGGLFDVTGAEALTVSVTTSNIKDLAPGQNVTNTWDNAGSRILDEVGRANNNWVIFVCAGKGVGQIREVSGRKGDWGKVTFAVKKPWRVVPDNTSRIILLAAFRENIVYKNLVDTGTLLKTNKSHGVLVWYAAFNNIFAQNTFRNMTAGVVINTRFRNPTGFNLTRGNTIEHIFGYTNGSSDTAAAYVDHYNPYGSKFPPLSEDRVWYSIGNIARDNVSRNINVAAYLHTLTLDGIQFAGENSNHQNGGMMMCVIENNRFEKAKEGIILSAGITWPVIRNNVINAADGEKIKYQGEPDLVHQPVIQGNREIHH